MIRQQMATVEYRLQSLDLPFPTIPRRMAAELCQRFARYRWFACVLVLLRCLWLWPPLFFCRPRCQIRLNQWMSLQRQAATVLPPG